jgi:ATP-dependent helicase/nuclease subunit B
MLKFVKVHSPTQIKSLLKTYDPLKDTWIVSDLKSKQEVQSESLEQYGYYTDDAILRVSDFWRLWIRRLEPTLQVVSSDFIKSLVQHFVDVHGDKIEISESEVSTLNKAVQEFAPILLHPSSEDILEEWLASQDSEKKWKRWYQLAKVCLNYIVYEKRALDAKWSAAYLQALDLNLITWPRKMYVDLGSELTTVEMGLFKHISQKQDVVIITPDPVWKDKFPYLLNTYKENFGFGHVKNLEATGRSSLLEPRQFIRLSTQLAEVKFTVAQVRQWLDAGVSVEKIAIISADVEKYWPVLQMYLEEEGIPYRKETVGQLNSLGDMQNLLAHLKSFSDEVSWESLEKSLYSKESSTQVKFEKFKALFYQLYDQDDLARDARIKNLFYQKMDFNAAVSRDEFLAFLAKTWLSLAGSSKKNELFEIMFKDVLAQSLNEKIKFRLWVQFFKNRLSHKEISIKKASSSGINVLPLMSAQMIDVSRRIYMGLNDEYYHRRKNSLMPLQDSMLLKSQFDLAVDNAEESYLDFNLRWQSSAAVEETLFTSSHLSFTSEPINSSLFFIENSP